MSVKAGELLLQEGCEIHPYSTLSGPIYGHQPAGYKCIGFGLEAIGATPDAAAENWLKAYAVRSVDMEKPE